MSQTLLEFVPGQIWLMEYPVHYAGLDFRSRMAIIRLANGSLMLHSPCHIDAGLQVAITDLGSVEHIVAPGSYHYLHLQSAQQAFPSAQVYICPGIEQKLPRLEFDWLLADQAPEAWRGEIEQVLVRGTRFICEVAFYHRSSQTLLLVDLIENIGDQTPGVGVGLKIWWKVVFGMWNNPKPAPEYQLGWQDKEAARRCLERILRWNFKRVVVAHGDLIEANAQQVVRRAWRNPIESG